MEVEIENTNNTPRVVLKDGKLQISGRSTAEDSESFYAPLIRLIENYPWSAGKSLKIDLSFEYISCNSTKSLLEIFRILEKAHERGNTIEINWYHDPDDDAMIELGSLLGSITPVRFNLVINDSNGTTNGIIK